MSSKRSMTEDKAVGGGVGIAREADAPRGDARSAGEIDVAPKAAAKEEKYDSQYIITVDHDGHGDHQTICEALDAARPGTIINVGPGTYHESLVIDKPDIRIIGAENVTVTSSNDHTVLVRAGDCTIKNMKLTYEGEDPMFFVVNMVRGMLLESCELIGNKAAYTILVGEDAYPLIRNNRIHHGRRGIKTASDGHARIEENLIYMNDRQGINLGHGSTASVTGNKIFNCGVGVLIGIESQVTLEKNEIYENQTGIIELMRSAHADDCGVLVCENGLSVIENNHLFNNEEGIEKNELVESVENQTLLSQD